MKKELLREKNIGIKIENNKYINCNGNLGMINKQIGGKDIIINKNKILLKSKSSYKVFKSLLQMMIKGVKKGYYKELEFEGLGYRFLNLKNGLYLKIGYSHYIKIKIPKSVKIFGFRTKLIIFGINLEEVNKIANEIRLLKKPDIYKGKGIRYIGEEIILKVGKKS